MGRRTLLTTDRWRTAGDVGTTSARRSSRRRCVTLNDRAGGRGIAFDTGRTMNVTAFGFPATAPFSGGRLWTCASAIVGSDTSVSPATMASTAT